MWYVPATPSKIFCTKYAKMIEDDFDIKKKVEEVLNETGFTDQRAEKLGVDELLK